MNIKLKARLLPVTMQIGKAGLSEAVIKEINAQLKNKKLIKIKFLKTAIKNKDKKELFKELAKKTQSEIVYSIGFVIALHKNRKNI